MGERTRGSDEMTFQMIDDLMVEHPKIAPLSDGSFRAMLELWSYCSRNLTDGLIPRRVALQITTPRRMLELVDARLFEVVVGGWIAHDWLDHNPSAEEIKRRRRMAAERKQRSRKRPKGEDTSRVT